jgi:hypothetical protein
MHPPYVGIQSLVVAVTGDGRRRRRNRVVGEVEGERRFNFHPSRLLIYGPAKLDEGGAGLDTIKLYSRATLIGTPCVLPLEGPIIWKVPLTEKALFYVINVPAKTSVRPNKTRSRYLEGPNI